MDGRMQDYPLTLEMMLRRCEQLGQGIDVVSVTPAGIDRRTWADVAARARRVAGVLDAVGVPAGAAIGTLAWNSHRHVELFLGVPCAGRVVHGANLRLSDEQLLYTIRHAGDRALFVDASLTGQFGWLRAELGDDVAFVVLDDGGDVDEAFVDAPRYEDLLRDSSPSAAIVSREGDAAWICFTSGTTGRPKGVVSSHRSAVLHSMQALMHDGHGVRRGDVVMPATPMFHVNAWGLPYTCALAPAKLVLPGRDTGPAALGALMEAEGVTVATGVPTVLIPMVAAWEAGEIDLSSLRSVLCGGAAAPRPLIARLTARGVAFFQAWGMTETSPSASGWHISSDEPRFDAGASGQVQAGWPAPGIEIRLVDPDSGAELPWDGEAVGELEARGPWAIASYLDPDDDSNERRFHDGWLRTEDLARIEPDGMVSVVDRTKDLIKSGGEWISSLELEQAIAAFPGTIEVAVVAMPDERWGERPAAFVTGDVDPESLKTFLAERLPKWWLPDRIDVVGELPKTGVGKYDKRALRERLALERSTQ